MGLQPGNDVCADDALSATKNIYPVTSDVPDTYIAVRFQLYPDFPAFSRPGPRLQLKPDLVCQSFATPTHSQTAGEPASP